MTDISGSSWDLQNADLRAREEENGLSIMESSSSDRPLYKWTSTLSPCLQFGRYHHRNTTITFILA